MVIEPELKSGTTPPAQVPGSLQFPPPLPFERICALELKPSRIHEAKSNIVSTAKVMKNADLQLFITP